MSQPLVSIIIPTYNRGHLIERALRSVRAQTYSPWQIIVIDDGSADGTKERLADIDDIEYYYQPNQGQAAARTQGLQYCRGEYIASLDSDDEWHPDFLANGMAMLQKHQLDFVFASWRTSNDCTGYAHNLLLPEQRKRFCTQTDNGWWLLSPSQNRRIMIENCPSPSSSLIIRRSSFPGSWNRQMRIADDWCMLLDMVINRPCRSAFTPIPHWTKHIHETNIWDCRDHTLIIPDVGFHDEQVLLDRFKHQLTPVEKRIFRRRLAMHHFTFAYFSWKKSVASSVVLRHLGIAFQLAPYRVSQELAVWSREHLQKRLSFKPVVLANGADDGADAPQCDTRSGGNRTGDYQREVSAAPGPPYRRDSGRSESVELPADST